MKVKIVAKTVATVAGVVLCTSLVSATHAATITLYTSGVDQGRGAFNSSEVVAALGQSWKVTSNSYQARAIGDGGVFGTPAASIQATRGYHLFDLPTLAAGEYITGAELRMHHSGNSYDSPDTTETVEFYDVNTAASVLRNPDDTQPLTVLADIFADLGSGSVYGSFDATIASNNTTESIFLNANAISSLMTGLGSEWGIGYSVINTTHTDFNVIERVFRGSEDNMPSSELILTVVPVPAAVWLFGSGLLGLVAIARRRSNELA